MVKFSDLIQFGLLIIALITLVTKVMRDKK